MITATLSGEEPAPQEIHYPILMKDKRDGQIVMARSRQGDNLHVLILSNVTDGAYKLGETESFRVHNFEVYHGEITLKNS